MRNLARMNLAIHSRSLSLAALAISLIVSDAALAQTARSGEEIVVTASKREEKLRDVGAGISVVTSQQLDDLHASSVQDFIQLLPGVSLQSNGTPGRETIAVRGVSPQGSGATTVTYIDDIAVGATSVEAEPSTYAIDINPSDVARVEVLKGPQGTLYGASSMGGVIKYVMKTPSLSQTGMSLTATGEAIEGGQASGNVRGSISIPLVRDQLALRVSGYYRGIGGYIDNSANGARNINSGHDGGITAMLFWKPSARFDVKLGLVHQSSRANGYDSVDINTATGQPEFGAYTQARYTPEFFHQTTDLLSSSITFHAGLGQVLLASSLSRTNNADGLDFSYLWQDYGLPGGASNPGLKSGIHRTEKHSEELRFTTNRLGPIEAIFGAYYNHEAVNFDAFYGYYDATANLGRGTSLGDYVQFANLTEFAGFANVTAYLSDTLDISGGIRRSHIVQNFVSAREGPLFTDTDGYVRTSEHFSEGATTYLAGLRWHPVKDVLLYARAASGYRPGGGRTVPPGAPAGLADYYVSDSLWNYEVGAKASLFDGRLSFDADVFLIDWNDIQSYIAIGDISIDGNGGKAVSKGVEGQITAVPLPGLTLSAAATYNDAHFTETTESFTAGGRVPGVAKATWTLSAAYDWSLGGAWKGTLGGDVSRRSSQLDSTLAPLPAYTMVNARFNLTNGRQSVGIYVRNLANTQAIIGTQLRYGSLPFWTANVTRPRTFGISATQSF